MMRTNYNFFIAVFFCLIGAFFPQTIWAQCNITGVAVDPFEPTVLCEGDTALFNFSSTGTCSGNFEYQVLEEGVIVQNWSTTNTFYTHPSDSTNFIVEARCSACPTTTVNAPFIVMVTKKPTVNGVNEICSGASVVLTATANGDETVSWWDSDVGGNQLSTDGNFTTPNLNDTTTFWVGANYSTYTGGVGKVLIAECGLDGASGGTGSEDYIEIANLYNVPINTSGWVVAVSNSYSNINSVNSIIWHLPSSFPPCNIVVKTDVASSPDYWGNNIYWNSSSSSWAIIIDDVGNVVDFAAWGWSAAQLASFNPTINGFSITLGSEWTGNGMPLPCGSQGSVQYSYARNGSQDNNNNTDFFCQPTSVNILNPGLNCGWTASQTCYFPVDVLVNPTPEIDPINDTTVCGGLTLAPITGTHLSGTEAYYTASGGNGTVYHAGDVISSSMTLYVYDSTQTALGCTNETSFDISITPNTMVFDAGPDLEVCDGVSITLTATGATNYSWNNGVSNGVAFNPPLDTTKYIVTGTDGPCTAIDSLIVIVHALPVVNAGNDTLICEGETLTLSGSGALTYDWNNGIHNGIAFSPPVGNTTYIVTGTDQYGCTDDDQLDVIVDALPSIDFSADEMYGCDPFFVTFSNQTPGNIVDVQWQLSNGDTSTNSTQFTTVLHASGCYDLTLKITNDNGCVNTLTKQDFICVWPDPVASFNISPAAITSLEPISQMQNTSTGAIGYIWNFGDLSLISNEKDPAHSYPTHTTTDYEVILTAISDKGCVDSAVGIVKMKELLLFYVPNSFTPDGDQINTTFQPVFYSGIDPMTYSLFIYNRWGELLFESHNSAIGWDGTYGGKIVSDGVYIWEINFKVKDEDERQRHHGTVTLIR